MPGRGRLVRQRQFSRNEVNVWLLTTVAPLDTVCSALALQ